MQEQKFFDKQISLVKNKTNFFKCDFSDCIFEKDIDLLYIDIVDKNFEPYMKVISDTRLKFQ